MPIRHSITNRIGVENVWVYNPRHPLKIYFGKNWSMRDDSKYQTRNSYLRNVVRVLMMTASAICTDSPYHGAILTSS